MERYSEVLGLPVICAENGKRLGTVKDVIFCLGLKEVKAFLLEHEGWHLYKRVILLRDVLDVGRDAVIVNDRKCVTGMRKAEKDGELQYKGELKDLRVYSKSGEDLGIVKDILFDHKTGLIEGLEISDGLLQDLIQGRKVLPLYGKVEFSSDNVLVGRESVEEIIETGRGLKKLLNR